MLPTLCGDSGGRYEVTPLMAPKTFIMWAQPLLHHGEGFKVVESVGNRDAFSFNTLYFSCCQTMSIVAFQRLSINLLGLHV